MKRIVHFAGDSALLIFLLLGTRAEAQTSRSASAAGAWQVKQTRSEMTDKGGVTLTLRASSPIQSIVGRATPTLVVRCSEGELDVYVNSTRVLDSDLGDETRVRLRYDEGQPISEDWSISSSHTSAFAPDPAAFVLGRILEAQSFRIELQPFDAAPVVAVFRPKGLRALLPRLRATCPTAFAPKGETARQPTPASRPVERNAISTEGIEFPFPGYLNNIVRQVLLRFNPADASSGSVAQIKFLIRRDGSVFGISFVTRSGSYAFDLEAQGAIEAAATQFGPLPKDFRDEVLPVVFNFDPRVVK